MRFLYVFVSILSIFVLASCNTQDYYRAKAVEKARDFAIPRLRDLQETQLDYIRYSPPSLLESEIFVRYQTDSKTPSKNDIYQTCIVWNLPDLDYSIVVFGVSERRMDDWTAERVIRKKFRTEDAEREAAIKLSVEYVMNNMLYLSDEMRNRVRFSQPKDYITSFELNADKYKTNKKMTRREKDLDAHKKSIQKQYSFVWDAENENEKIVVSGFCLEKFAGWTVFTGLVRTKTELEENTIKPKETEKAKENVKDEDSDITEITEITESQPPPPSKEKVYDSGSSPDSGSGFKQLNKFQR